MLVLKDVHRVGRHSARIASRACLLTIAVAVVACATSTEGPLPDDPTGGRSTSTGAAGGEGGGGGAGGDGGAGGSGGTPMCAPGAVLDCYSGPDGTVGIGVCVGGKKTCKADGSDFGPCEGEVVPAAEACATPVDDDCDGKVNESADGCVCTPNESMPCYSGPDGTMGVGVCVGGTKTCNAEGTAWGGCEGEITPTPEDCANVLDDDCNKVVCAEPKWSLIFGGPLDDRATSVAVDSMGNVFVAGTFSGTMTIGGEQLLSAGGTDGFLAKFDPQGVYQWSQAFGDAADQAVTAVAIDPGDFDSVVIGGSFGGTLALGGAGGVSFVAKGKDGFVAKFGNMGSFTWAKRIGDAGTESVAALAIDSMGEILVGGTFDKNLFCILTCRVSAGGQDIFLYKYDKAGAQKWVKWYGDPADQFLNGLDVDSMRNVILVGDFSGSAVDFGGGSPLGSAGGFDVFVAKLDPAGAHIWSRRFGDPLDQRASAVAVDPLDNVVLVGSFKGTINFGALDLSSADLPDIFVAELAPDSSYLWAQAYGDPSEQGAAGVAVDEVGNVFVTGKFQGMVDFGGGALSSAVSYDLFLLKLSDQGSHIWSKDFGNSTSQIGVGLALDPMSGGLITAGVVAGTIDFGLGALTSAGGDDSAVFKMIP